MKKTRKIFAVALALMLLLSTMSIFAGAAEAAVQTNGRVVDGYEPIPLLVIKVNCEVDGDGKDCYEIKYEEDVLDDKGNVLFSAGERKYAYARWKKTESAQYGEQYCYSPDEYWANLCFGEGFGTLNDYYKYISGDRFYWIPAEETSGTANDGVITVTVNAKHPGSMYSNGTTSGDERGKALAAADEFVDYSKFDTNKDGKIDFTELSVVFIYGGAEISYSTVTSYQYSYPTHAHVSHMSYTNTHDGVQLWSDLPYVRMGEYAGSSKQWSQMGKLAHELGHVLNAKDLYTNAEGWVGGCGQLSLMGSGSGGMNAGSSSPTVLDPYYKVLYGFAEETVAKSGTNEYTLYSHESTEGEFNVIRVNYPNSNEYLLIENRSHSSSGYDNNGLNGDMQGILIWHIDQGIVNGASRPNNASEGHAAGFTVITPINNIQDSDANSTWSKDSASNVFVASNAAQYKFPVNSADDPDATWHTSLTAEQAADCNIKIEFLTSAGNEMTIRISGAYDLAPEFTGSSLNATQTSISLKAYITDFNGAEINSCTMKLSADKNLAGAKEITVTKNADGDYIGEFDELTADTEYYYSITMESTHGTIVKEGSVYTLPVPVEKTKATITVYANSDKVTKTTSKVAVGSTITINNVWVTKNGYTFEGWYLDEEFTQPFDVNAPLESTEDFAIYAKWKQDATTGTTAAPAEPGENGGDTGSSGGCGSSIASGAVICTAVLGLGAGFIRKKKEQ